MVSTLIDFITLSYLDHKHQQFIILQTAYQPVLSDTIASRCSSTSSSE